MKKSIFITGIAGSGKSSISRKLNKLGYKAYDIEKLEGMFKMIRKDTGEDFKDYDSTNIEKIKNSDWICNKNKLKELLRKQCDEICFYCGNASNNNEIIPLFNQTILLMVNPEVLYKRLSNRKGTNETGNTVENREWVLSGKDLWENQIIKQGVVIINANGDLIEVVRKIIKLTKE